MNIINPFNNLKLMKSENLHVIDRVQCRRPKSKKKRIRDKWTKRQENFRHVEKDQCFMVYGMLICSPSLFKKITDSVMRNIEYEMLCGPQLSYEQSIPIHPYADPTLRSPIHEQPSRQQAPFPGPFHR